MPGRIILEIAIDTVKDAAAAADAGADRLEVCADLCMHGVTPEADLVSRIKSTVRIPAVAMVRPRPGGFVYTREEAAALLDQARAVLDAGADGVVFGALTPDGMVDEALTARLVEVAGARESVFHRAIDLTHNPADSARALARLGVRRILSAGQSPAAAAASMNIESTSLVRTSGTIPESEPQRVARLRELASRSPCALMFGGGIRASNVATFLAESSIRQVHSSCRLSGAPDPAVLEALVSAIRRFDRAPSLPGRDGRL